ncbi:hypothetical protein EX30DRAFT_355172 [Ascodesmis nigricans]|uniref:DUF202 domain-containing protein n=1 Tax=Ascodesmis nigricans TaxID=341454 RepID=A0A4S2MWD9_9PEZI|nr:hypothetical protein EX30DRAFT_355172 [Ascodesmis nigricans]
MGMIWENSIQPGGPVILASPFISPLIFANEASDARDHCANERNFLSWLRLSIYMCVVAVAIILNFNLKEAPTPTEKRMSLPMGVIFWMLSLLCLGTGMGIYTNTVQRYSRKSAIVESGLKTRFVFIVVSASIVGACVIFLTTNATNN